MTAGQPLAGAVPASFESSGMKFLLNFQQLAEGFAPISLAAASGGKSGFPQTSPSIWRRAQYHAGLIRGDDLTGTR
jgi:hypothetical protein